jgi:hypothetical protein
MKPASPLVLEIDAVAKDRVCRLAGRWGWRALEVRRDLAGIERCLVLVRGNRAEVHDE